MVAIISLSNPLVKQARALRQKKIRSETGLFLIEGIHNVGAAAEAGWELQTVFYAPDLLTSSYARELLARLPIPTQSVSRQVMESIADKENPQGILAIARQRRLALAEVKPFRQATALVSPQDPGNVGTVLRTLDAVGADMLFLLEGGVELYHPAVVRASMGALFWIPVAQCSFAEFVAWARRGGYQLIGSSAKADVDYRTLEPQVPWALILGNEQKGLSKEQAAACDVTVSLPMRGRGSSLNLSVAAGALLYSFVK